MARELRSVRTRHDDPDIPDSVKPDDLDRVARNELKTLTKENAEWVARHLVMAATLIDDDPTRAHQHALSAARRAGRIGVVRETLAITAYETGDYALALRELRTYRRITGSNDQLPLMVDSERGVGRPERALELGRTVDRATLTPAVRVALSIAMSGARLDLGQSDMALAELQVPELDPNKAFEWSPELFAAYAEVLGELERSDEAAVWRKRAIVAAEVLDERNGVFESETMDVYEEELEGEEELESGEELESQDGIEYEDGVPPVSAEDDLSEAGEPVAGSANEASYIDDGVAVDGVAEAEAEAEGGRAGAEAGHSEVNDADREAGMEEGVAEDGEAVAVDGEAESAESGRAAESGQAGDDGAAAAVVDEKDERRAEKDERRAEKED